jgi:hypothetical protein
MVQHYPVFNSGEFATIKPLECERFRINQVAIWQIQTLTATHNRSLPGGKEDLL